MSNFDELKAALAAKKKATPSYEEQVAKAKEILGKLGNTLLDHEGEKFTEEIRVVEHKLKTGGRIALVLEQDEEPIFSLLYAKDGSSKRAIDLNPKSDDEPLKLNDQDAEDISEVFEYLADEARKKQKSEDEDSDEKPGSLSEFVDHLIKHTSNPGLKEALAKVKEAEIPLNEEDKFINIITKLTNTVKDLEGPKYDGKVKMFMHYDTYIFTVNDKEVLIVSSHCGICKVGTCVADGPEALRFVPTRMNRLLNEFLEFAKKNIKNEFDADGLPKMLDALFDVMPSNIRRRILGDLKDHLGIK